MGIWTTILINNEFDLIQKVFDFINKYEILNINLLVDINPITLLWFFAVFVLASISNDIDNMHSTIWKILFPISIVFHLLSYILYRIFYNKSYSARHRMIKESVTSKNSFLANLFGISFFEYTSTTFAVVHRMLFHSEIWLIILLYCANLIDTTYYNFSDIYYIAIIGWYLTHLLLDYIHWKIPIFLTLRLIFMIFWIKKEVIWLNWRIW